MREKKTFAEQILQFNEKLSHELFELPSGYKIINPFVGEQKQQVKEVTTAFYKKYYNDTSTRRLILGSSPARRGTAVTGIPFEDAKHLQSETGIFIDKFYVNKSSSGFLYDVMKEYGGCKKFYTDFYMNFVCPLGIVRINAKGNEVNCNYYENKKLQETLYSFIISAIRSQINFGIDTQKQKLKVILDNNQKIVNKKREEQYSYQELFNKNKTFRTSTLYYAIQFKA